MVLMGGRDIFSPGCGYFEGPCPFVSQECRRRKLFCKFSCSTLLEEPVSSSLLSGGPAGKAHESVWSALFLKCS